MKISFITCWDILNRQKWQANEIGLLGTHSYKAKALEAQGCSLEYIISQGKLSLKHQWTIKVKKHLYKHFTNQIYYPWAEPFVSKSDAKTISKILSGSNSDIAFFTDINLIADLECSQPIVFWITNLFTGLIEIDYYDEFKNLCWETTQHLKRIDKLALDKCRLAIFPSEWAATTAITHLGVNPSKVKVIPYGANIECDRTINDIKSLVEARPKNKCKLLFLGVSWFRKGGDIALEVARELNRLGLNTELTIVGSSPIKTELLPNFVSNPGFINKFTETGLEQLNNLITESHFLIMPSRAETYGNVLCEANSFGVPCLASNVGGIPTIIKDNLNGKTFSSNANISEYCNYIIFLMNNYNEYKQLAFSSFHEYESRLNWTIAGQEIKKTLIEIL